MKSPFYNKKIGIWGFGIVGKSALHFFKTITNQIEILTLSPIGETTSSYKNVIQTDESITQFLSSNDYIIASPGIPLHAYKEFESKFITELDLVQQHSNFPTIAITGTLGKTTITKILSSTLSRVMRNNYAAGNIGIPMLDLCIKDKVASAVLEVSSFQLQHIKQYAPDLAIWSNFYPNHLDHHTSLQEYFEAKCNIIKYQSPRQKALFPLDLKQDIEKVTGQISQWYTFTTKDITQEECNETIPIFFIKNKIVYLKKNNKMQEIYSFKKLPQITLEENMLILVAATYLSNIDITLLAKALQETAIPHHRVETVATIGETSFINDSKATVWQATLEAVKSMPSNKPIQLFLGGLSKGASKKELFENIKHLPITIFSFGKEADDISKECNKKNIVCHTASTLQESFEQCIKATTKPSSILFSPSGSSFDLFKNYQDRGNQFVKLVKQHENMLQKQGTK